MNVILIVLACMVLTSLFVSDQEQKTFEYAMLRVLGLPPKNIMYMLALQVFFCMKYNLNAQAGMMSTPGTLAALLIAFIAAIPISHFFIAFFGQQLPIIGAVPMTLGLLCGILLPVMVYIHALLTDGRLWR
jgi:hypothetical protein